MTLIKSISGIRGTIGGQAGESLSPIDVVKFASAFGSWLLQKTGKAKVVIGRDARPSGQLVSDLVSRSLQALGIDVIDLGLSTTPTVEIAVPLEEAGGGIIITASHNPEQWNALKLLNHHGEFISAQDGKEVLDIADREAIAFAEVLKLGNYSQNDTYISKHIELILGLPEVDRDLISQANLRVVVDAVNSSGGIAVPQLLRALGVNQIKELYCEPTGHFPHNPEPLPEHIGHICGELESGQHDLGIIEDTDVDRLAQVVDPQVDLRGPVEQLGAHVGHHRLRQLVDAPLEPTETVANPSTGEQGADQAAERAHRVGCSTSLGRRSSMPAS